MTSKRVAIIKMTETDLKRTLKDYLRIKGITVIHHLQGIGSFKGMPDLSMHYKGRVHYIEVKLPNSRQSNHQAEFQMMCDADCIPYHVIHSLEELQEIVPFIKAKRTLEIIRARGK